MSRELKEARKLVAEYREAKTIEPAVIFTSGAEAAIVLDSHIGLLERRLNQLLSDAVPDKKWNKVYQGSAIDYLRHRAAHFIKNYGDPARGARMNQLANELEQKDKRLAELLKEAGA